MQRAGCPDTAKAGGGATVTLECPNFKDRMHRSNQ